MIKEERKGEKINHPRYINYFVCEMMRLDKLLNEYETTKLEAKNDLFKIVKENKEIRKIKYKLQMI